MNLNIKRSVNAVSVFMVVIDYLLDIVVYKVIEKIIVEELFAIYLVNLKEVVSYDNDFDWDTIQDAI